MSADTAAPPHSSPDGASPTIRLLLVDDQPLVRSGLRLMLRPRDGVSIVAECDDGAGVPDALATHPVDVVVMDLRMKHVDGIEATRRLRTDRSAPPVLVLTTFDDDELLSGALRAGAAGFVLKDAPATDLLRAVHAVADGQSWLDPAVTARVLAAYCTTAPAAASAETSGSAVTARERDVLALIGLGRSNSEIAAELFISELTVKSHIGRIFTKLDLRDRPAAIVYAFDHGIAYPAGH